MRHVHVLVEGQTEEVVVRDVLAPEIEGPDTWVTYSVLTSSRTPAGVKARGGVSTWSRIYRELRQLLGDTSIDLLTTMLDYYAIPADTPGLADRPSGSARERVDHVERAMAGGGCLAAVSAAPHVARDRGVGVGSRGCARSPVGRARSGSTDIPACRCGGWSGVRRRWSGNGAVEALGAAVPQLPEGRRWSGGNSPGRAQGRLGAVSARGSVGRGPTGVSAGSSGGRGRGGG
jgi:hypothetical protein